MILLRFFSFSQIQDIMKGEPSSECFIEPEGGGFAVSQNDWKENLSMFNSEMFRVICLNMPEKGKSWRRMRDEDLLNLLDDYIERHDFVSVANISFMLWENRIKRKLRRPIKGIASGVQK